MQERTTTQLHNLGDLEVTFITHWVGDKRLNTMVYINGEYLITISPTNLFKFSEELDQVINKYRI